jgi:hypothetical protein
MEELYRFVNIPSFEQVQIELFNAIDYNYQLKGKHANNYTPDYMRSQCPTLMTWLDSRNKFPAKFPYRLLRYYFTPAHDTLSPHIDGGNTKVPFGLNIPVLNCNNTTMTWWNCNEENTYIPPEENGYLGSIIPKDITKITPREKLELIKPCFTRNDIMHSVENPNDTIRIMFTVRWALHPTKFRTIEEVIDTDGLFYE